MEQWKYLGEGFEPGKPGYPYQVAIYWPPNPSADTQWKPILLGEGSGLMSAGGLFALADLLGEKWTTHLEFCDCLYLRDLAREEAREGRAWTREEIWEKWQARPRNHSASSP